MGEPISRPDGLHPDRAALAPRFLRAWYLGTPAFAVLDFVLGLNVRTAFLDSAPARLAYYAFAFGCGLAVLRWPGRAALVGLLESGGNIVWLIVGVGLQYVAALDSALAEEVVQVPLYTPAEVINLLVSATVLIVSYVGAQARLGRQLARLPFR